MLKVQLSNLRLVSININKYALHSSQVDVT
jgi:hypothetical protein